MSEEAQYTEHVPEYKNKSRFPILSRYRDLMLYVKSAFADGKISDDELNHIETMEKDILLEYQVAADIFFKMDAFSPQYAAARKLLNHLHRCNVFMTFAYKYAKDKHDTETMGQQGRDLNREIVRQNTQQSKVIQLSATMVGIDLLKSLESRKQRIEADLPRIRRDLAKLSPEERAELEGKINAILEQMRDRQIEQLSVYELNRLIGLDQYLGEVRVRE